MDSLKKYILKATDWSKGILFGDLDTDEMSAQDTKDFRELQSGQYEKWRIETNSLFDKEESLRDLKQQISPKSRSKIIRLMQYWQSAAAILIIAALAYGGYFIYQDLQNSQEVLPGRSMAYLEVDNTERIELTHVDTLLSFKESHVKLDSGKVVYSGKEVIKERSEYHKINVPRNAEFYVQLSDGTKVWINSESNIGFKSKFEENRRVVDLVGEAYFEVAKDPEKPFIVRTNNMDVRVLGTHFNIKAYPDEDYTYATLNEGRIRVYEDDIQEDLEPNQQLVLNNANKEYSTQKVDASIYSAWVKGKFHFKNERLEVILTALARWYDLKVFYENPALKDDRFSVRVNRYDDIEKLLHHIELTGGIEFEINKGALIVKSK
jgi:hypothetical protein